MNPLKPLFDYLEKARSHVYGIFIFWVVTGFSPVIFTILFVNQDLIYKEKHLLKGEYIRQSFFNFNHPASWLYVVGVLVIAGWLTWLTIWKFPKWIVNRAYHEELKDHYARENMKLDEEDKLNKRKKALTDQQLETVKKEEALTEKQEQLESKDEKEWTKAYESFRKTNLFNFFHQLIDCLYENNGYYNDTVDTELLAYLDSNDLVELDRNRAQLGLTQKGRYFVQNYQQDRHSKK